MTLGRYNVSCNIKYLTQTVDSIDEMHASTACSCMNLSQPLRKLLTKHHIYTWGPSQAKAFLNIKEILTQPHVFTWYDPSAETTVSADASAYTLLVILSNGCDLRSDM